MMPQDGSRRIELTLLTGLLAAAFGLLVFRLVETNANPSPRNGWYRESMSYDEIKSHLDHGADPNESVREAGVTRWPLLLAVRHGNMNQTQLLLSRGADSSIRNYAILNEAARQNNKALMKLLIARKVPKEALNRALLTSGHSTEIMEILLNAGAD